MIEIEHFLFSLKNILAFYLIFKQPTEYQNNAALFLQTPFRFRCQLETSYPSNLVRIFVPDELNYAPIGVI